MLKSSRAYTNRWTWTNRDRIGEVILADLTNSYGNNHVSMLNFFRLFYQLEMYINIPMVFFFFSNFWLGTSLSPIKYKSNIHYFHFAIHYALSYHSYNIVYKGFIIKHWTLSLYYMPSFNNCSTEALEILFIFSIWRFKPIYREIP